MQQLKTRHDTTLDIQEMPPRNGGKGRKEGVDDKLQILIIAFKKNAIYVFIDPMIENGTAQNEKRSIKYNSTPYRS